MKRFLLLVATLALADSPALAQFKSAAADQGPKLGRETTTRIQIGVRVKAVGGACSGIHCTLPIPMEWPEQQVKIVEEDVSPTVRLGKNRVIGGSATQMVVDIPSLSAGQVAKAIYTFEVTRRELVAPEATQGYKIPAKPVRELQPYLTPSPYIDSKHPKITALAKQIVGEQDSDWRKVEALYDWVREHVVYQEGELKGALRALSDKTGDCEDFSSLFIALCRAQKIPARTVWVGSHCYPEFYLLDGEGTGHWFPCQAAGSRAFGGIVESRPILQKGDNFRDPDQPGKRLRYLSEFMKGLVKGGGQPKATFISSVE